MAASGDLMDVRQVFSSYEFQDVDTVRDVKFCPRCATDLNVKSIEGIINAQFNPEPAIRNISFGYCEPNFPSLFERILGYKLLVLNFLIHSSGMSSDFHFPSFINKYANRA